MFRLFTGGRARHALPGRDTTRTAPPTLVLGVIAEYLREVSGSPRGARVVDAAHLSGCSKRRRRRILRGRSTVTHLVEGRPHR